MAVSQGAERVTWTETPTPKCMVLFRPHDNYKGEFGFDWLRVKDNDLAEEPDYESIILSGYKDGISDYSDKEAYAVLKSEYRKMPIYGFRSDDSNSGEYYVPYLNLYPKTYSDTITELGLKPPYEAKLKVLVEIKDADVEEIKLEYDGTIFSINEQDTFSLDDKKVCDLQASLNWEIKITCKKEIRNCFEGEICAYAYYEDDKGELKKVLAGKIQVGPNDASSRKTVKLVMVSLRTNLAGERKEGKWDDSEKEKIWGIFYQALVHPKLCSEYNGTRGLVTLDLTQDPDFLPGGKYVNVIGTLKVDGNTIRTMIKDLTSKFFTVRSNVQYIDCIPAYIMEERVPYSKGLSIAGFADANYNASGERVGFSNKSISFLSRDLGTISHEILHGLQLYHTHRDDNLPLKHPNIKYIYPYKGTDNIMTHATVKRTTWHWQWQIIRRNL